MQHKIRGGQRELLELSWESESSKGLLSAMWTGTREEPSLSLQGLESYQL